MEERRTTWLLPEPEETRRMKMLRSAAHALIALLFCPRLLLRELVREERERRKFDSNFDREGPP